MREKERTTKNSKKKENSPYDIQYYYEKYSVNNIFFRVISKGYVSV